MVQDRTIEGTRRQGMFLAAGIGAGAVAAVGSIGIQLATGVHIASLPEVAWSAFVAGIAGGLLYWGLADVVRRPIPALWGVGLGVAEIDDVLICVRRLQRGNGVAIGDVSNGLIV